jgi:hypothetical protein
MFSNFSNLSIVDPNTKPIITIDPTSFGKDKNNNTGNTNTYEVKQNKARKNNKRGYKNNNYYYGNEGRYHENNYNNGQYQNYNKKSRHTRDQKYASNHTGNKANANPQNNLTNENASLYEEDKISKLSSATPLHETETKEEVASTIYEIVEKRYPE